MESNLALPHLYSSMTDLSWSFSFAFWQYIATSVRPGSTPKHLLVNLLISASIAPTVVSLFHILVLYRPTIQDHSAVARLRRNTTQRDTEALFHHIPFVQSGPNLIILGFMGRQCTLKSETNLVLVITRRVYGFHSKIIYSTGMHGYEPILGFFFQFLRQLCSR